MSALTDRIAAEHVYIWSAAHCSCGNDVWGEDYAGHVAAATEAAVLAEIRSKHADITRRRRQRKAITRDFQHGTRSGYSDGCRCDGCRKANTLAMAEYRSRRRAEGRADR